MLHADSSANANFYLRKSQSNKKQKNEKHTHSENSKSEWSLKIWVFQFWQVTCSNQDSKFIFSRKGPTYLLGFVIIRLGARAMKQFF